MPIGRSKVRTRVESPTPSARTASSLFAWYVLTSRDAPSSWSRATKPSVWVYRNSTGAGGAARPSVVGACRRLTSAFMSWLLGLRSVARLGTLPSVVVQDRADATGLGEQRVAAVAEQVEVEGLVRLPLVVALDLDRDRFR